MIVVTLKGGGAYVHELSAREIKQQIQIAQGSFYTVNIANQIIGILTVPDSCSKIVSVTENKNFKSESKKGKRKNEKSRVCRDCTGSVKECGQNRSERLQERSGQH